MADQRYGGRREAWDAESVVVRDLHHRILLQGIDGVVWERHSDLGGRYLDTGGVADRDRLDLCGGGGTHAGGPVHDRVAHRFAGRGGDAAVTVNRLRHLNNAYQ